MRKRLCHDHKTWTSDNWKSARDVVRCVVHHVVPYIRKSVLYVSRTYKEACSSAFV
jgi:hypothetical protein